MQSTFEGEDGFLRVYLHDRCDRDALRAGLGQRWEFTNLSYKAYPCCRFNHTAIDAAIALRSRHGLRADDVRRVRVGVNHQAYEAVCTPVAMRKAPTTVVQAQFSIPYTVAAALVDGRVGLSHFTPEGVRRDDVLAVASRVDAHEDAAIEREWSRNISPAVVEIEMNDGTRHVERIDVPSGHPQRPMTTTEIERKIDDCAAFAAVPLRGDTAVRLRECVARLEQLADLHPLFACVHHG